MAGDIVTVARIRAVQHCSVASACPRKTHAKYDVSTLRVRANADMAVRPFMHCFIQTAHYQSPGESGEGSWGDGAIEEVVFPSGTLAFYAHGVLAWSSF